MRRILTLLSIFTLSLSMMSCGNNSKKIVSGIEVETADQNQNKMVVADFKLDIGASELPFLHLTLPKDYGVLRTYVSGGVSHVAVDLNLTEILKLEGTVATLPNGTLIPVDTNGSGVIEIEISAINGKVYVAQKGDMTLVGFAFSIKQLDGIGDSVGTAGIFPNFNIGAVKMTAGIFTSEETKGTGIAAFANLGGLWNNLGEKRVYPVAYDAEAFTFEPMERFTKREKRQLYKKLNKVLKTKQTLELVK